MRDWLEPQSEIIDVDELLRGTITIDTSAGCNLACPACNDRDCAKANPTYQTTLDHIDRLIESCQRYGYEFEVNLAGGEPLLWSCVLLWIHHAVHQWDVSGSVER